MAEIFGAVVAGFAVCHEMSCLAIKIRKIAKTVKNAPKDIATLADETVIFTGLYAAFLQTCEDDPNNCHGATMSIQRLKKWADSTIRQLHKILNEGDALSPDTQYRYSLGRTIKAHWKWLVRRNVVTHLRDSLNVARTCIEGFSNIICIRKLNEELALLRGALANPAERRVLEQRMGMRLEEKIQSIQAQINIRHPVRAANARMLKEAQDRIAEQQENDLEDTEIATLNAALNVADAFDTYAEEILPLRADSARSRESASSRASSGLSNAARRSHRTSSSASSSGSLSGSSVSGHFARSPPLSIPPVTAAVNRAASAGRHIPRQEATSSHDCPRAFIAVPESNPKYEVEAQPSRRGMSRTVLTKTHVPEASNAKVGVAPDHPEDHITISPRPNEDSNPASLRKTVRIGRNTVILTETEFFVNQHSMPLYDVEMGESFLRTLLDHPDSVDRLDQALYLKIDDWDGVPGWVVRPTRISIPQDTGGTREA